MEPILTAVVAIGSGILGFGASLWRLRIRPWISLLGFSESRRAGDPVEIPEKLYEAAERSWFMENFPKGTGTLSEVYRSFIAGSAWLEMCDVQEGRLQAGIDQLRQSKDPEELIKALAPVLSARSVSDLLELAIVRQKIIPPKHDQALETKVEVYENTAEANGCYVVAFPTEVVHFGSEFNDAPFRKARLAPFMELVSRLEKDKLVKVLEELGPFWRDQIDTQRAVKEHSERIVEDSSRWMCEFTATNFGSTPFVLFADQTRLHIKSKHLKHLVLDCQLLTKDEDGDWVPVDGAHVLTSGMRESLAIVTRDVQGRMDFGEILRAAYKAGSAEAWAELLALGSEIPWKRWIKTTRIKFA